MIQFNLLPDVKLEYIRSQRLKRSTVGIAVVAAAGALFILIMLFLVVDVFQKQHLNGLNSDIKTDSSKLQSVTDLNKILTIQNQLNSLPALHAQKPVTSRLFTYISQIVPNNVSIAQLNIDFDQHTLTFTGSADGISTVNKFTDTLKFTTYKTSNGTNSPNAFSDVVLSSFARTDKGASYSISTNFDATIFDSSQTVQLIVPSIVTTRSETEKPSDLFKEQPQTTTNTQGTQ